MRDLFSLAWVERHPGRTLAAIGVIFAVTYVGALTLVPRSRGRLVDGDTIQYYAYLRSMVIDGDLDFTNDYKLLYTPRVGFDDTDNVWLRSTTPIGRRPNLMSIGPALVWAPFFLATYVALLALRPLGVTVPLDGIAAPFPLSAGVAGVVCAVLGAWFCYRACRALFPRGPAIWGALAAWLASPAIYYSLVSPAYSHAPSMLASAVFCDAWLRTRGGRRVARYVGLGAVAGIAALIRWQDIVILLLPLLELLYEIGRKERTLASATRDGLILGASAAAGLIPQLIAWHAIYGQYLLVPQGSGFMQWSHPAVLPVLLSLRHGLLTWTPALIIAIAGLVALVRRDRLVGWAVIATLAVTIYVNASVSDWWAGAAFGARRFISDTVFFALGFAAVFAGGFWRERPVLLRWAVTALVIYNVLFLLQYQLFMHGMLDLAPEPVTARQVLLDRLTLPVRALSAWIR
jgi:hypothetical protein